jgi:hypothetical protein
MLNTGDRVDLTRMAKFQLDGNVATVSPQGRVRASTDGQAQLLLEVAGHKANIPVTVTGIAAKSPVSFVRDVAPVLSKVGCNQGTCHGSKDGKNGFKH